MKSSAKECFERTCFSIREIIFDGRLLVGLDGVEKYCPFLLDFLRFICPNPTRGLTWDLWADPKPYLSSHTRSYPNFLFVLHWFGNVTATARFTCDFIPMGRDWTQKMRIYSDKAKTWTFTMADQESVAANCHAAVKLGYNRVLWFFLLSKLQSNLIRH